MKNIKSYLFASIAAIASFSFATSCGDSVIEQMKNADEAMMLYEFSLVDSLGKVYKSNFDGTNTNISVKIKLRDSIMLTNASARCFLSYGATISPNPSEPRDYTVPGGVNFTVTSASGKNKTVYNITWEKSKVLPYGEGFSGIEKLFNKTFPELGYPGGIYFEGCPYNRVEYGDMMAYVAFCGPNHIALYSRAYGWGYDNQEGTTYPANEDLAIRVFNKETGEEDAFLNLGESMGSYIVDVKKILAITSDDKGNMVAVTGLYPDRQELFYWTDPNAAPISLGTAPLCLDFRQTLDNGQKKFLDMYANPQIRGDVTKNATFTMGGLRTGSETARAERGQHYIMKIVNGRLSSQYDLIYTRVQSAGFGGGYGQADPLYPYWQMISPYDASDTTDYVLSYTEGVRFPSADVANQETARVRGLGNDLSIKYEMENNVLNTRQIINDGADTWWSKLGMYPLNVGVRVPVANAMIINGKKYVLLSTQYDWNSAFVITDETMTAKSVTDDHIFVDPIGVARSTTFGCWSDWYYDEDEDECYITVWFERAGLHSYKVTCQKIS